MNKCNPMLLLDFYKVSHRSQYPKNTNQVYSTWTPRASRMKNVRHVVAFGFQAFIKKYLIEYFNENFFSRSKEDVVNEYKRVIKYTLGGEPETKHIEELHDLGYLPLEIRALDEGTIVPIRVPMMTIHNTDSRFYWLTNYIETLASSELWQASTSATIANEYRKMLMNYASLTSSALDFVQFQGHDFSFRGFSSVESATTSGMGHLLSFVGTDTVPSIIAAENYYNANVEKELVGTSIPATEHSVACSYGKDGEKEYYRRMIQEVYPEGFVSIVSDTWDLWNVINNIIAPMKDVIINRNGKTVLRPDSGDPVKIICGDPSSDNINERKGVVELLWDIFGGTINSKGYKELDPHIGCIYGDAITLERCEQICELLKAKGFASTNMVYGIGSFTYQYNTRDTFGFALKSTLVNIDGKETFIFKDPVTDDGTKKSQKGRVAVMESSYGLSYKDELSLGEEVSGDLLKTIFLNGKLTNEQMFSQIRNKLTNENLKLATVQLNVYNF